jgi:hypothetical protein
MCDSVAPVGLRLSRRSAWRLMDGSGACSVFVLPALVDIHGLGTVPSLSRAGIINACASTVRKPN